MLYLLSNILSLLVYLLSMLLWRIVNHKFLESPPGVSHLGTKLFISLPYQPCHRPSFLSTLSLTSLFTSLSCLSSTFYQHAIVLVIDLLSTRRLPRLTPKRPCYSTRKEETARRQFERPRRRSKTTLTLTLFWLWKHSLLPPLLLVIAFTVSLLSCRHLAALKYKIL